jgi:hypothetical protein
VLERIAEGIPWPTASREVYSGSGSMGNGGAMRVAPLGAYFAEDYDLVVEQARALAEVTHAHPEGQYGAIATAVAAAWAWNARPRPRDGRDMIGAVGMGSRRFGTAETEVRLWDLNQDRVRAILKGELGTVRALAFAPDGRRLVTVSRQFLVHRDIGRLPLTDHGEQTVPGPPGYRSVTVNRPRRAGTP